MLKRNLKILFIGKTGDPYSLLAADFLSLHFEDPLIVFSKRGEKVPTYLSAWQGDLLISYLAQWIIPQQLLEKASMAAINFHPGTPEYPGIGCTNFAIYNGENQFGITCHHMLAQVDSGQIIAVRRFPLYETDTVFSITQRCYAGIIHLFMELMDDLLHGEPLPVSEERWQRKPYKRKELDQLCELTPDMGQEEIERRLRATTYGGKVWAYMNTQSNQYESIPTSSK